jgi:hypothetical protein
VQNDDNPPQRLGVTPSPQLSVRKARQTRAQPRGQLGQDHPFSSSTSSTLTAAYDLRRPVKARPPLTNIYDRASMSNAESPLAPHATGREEESPLSRRSPPVALTEGSNTLHQPRLKRWLPPHVTITPEVTTVERGCHRFWVAIEVSIRQWPETAMISQPGAS